MTSPQWYEERIDDLEALVKWLALPLDGKTPIFATRNVFTDEPLMAGIRLRATWVSVMGDTGPAAPGEWVRCEECGSLYVDSQSEPAGLSPSAQAVFDRWAEEFASLSEESRALLNDLFGSDGSPS